MDSPYFDVSRFLVSLSQYEIVEELLVLRGEKAKLSGVKIDQRSFKYLKKLGVFDSFLTSESKNWLSFTYTEQIILRITETLWKYGFEVESIKSVVDTLLSDDWLQDYINTHLLPIKLTAETIHGKEYEIPSFLEYCVLEKMKNPNLRAFTNLDALLISSFASNVSISLILNQHGEWLVLAGTDTSKLSKSLFKYSFVNITLKGIFDELIIPNKVKSPILNPNLAGRKNLDSLISKGFDYKDIRQLEIDNDNLEFECIELPANSNIGKAKNEYANQDILIKIRHSKVSSVKQLVIKKK